VTERNGPDVGRESLADAAAAWVPPWERARAVAPAEPPDEPTTDDRGVLEPPGVVPQESTITDEEVADLPADQGLVAAEEGSTHDHNSLIDEQRAVGEKDEDPQAARR